MTEKPPDDEDEEVQQIKDFLRYNYLLDQTSTALTSASSVIAQTDNHPHLTSLVTPSFEPALSVDSTEHFITPQHPLPYATGPCSSLGPGRFSPLNATPKTTDFLHQHLAGLNDNNSAHFHLDSAYMLVSAGQLMHPK